MPMFRDLTEPRENNPFVILPGQTLPGETHPIVPPPAPYIGPPPPSPDQLPPPGVQPFRSPFRSLPSTGGVQSASKGATPPTSVTTQTSSPMNGMMIPLLIGGGILLIILIR